MRICTIIAALGIFNIVIGEEVSPEQRFEYIRKVAGGTIENGIAAIPLDSDVFRHSLPEFRDVRLMRLDGDSLTEVPYLISRLERPKPTRANSIPAIITRFTDREDDAIEVVAKLEKEMSAAVVTIRTPLSNFEKIVQIAGSTDGEIWTPLVNDQLIFDYARFIDFRRTAITLPSNSSHYFKLTIADATDQQQSLVTSLRRTVSDSSGVLVETSTSEKTRTFRIDQVEFATRPTKPETRVSGVRYPIEVVTMEIDEERKLTELLLDTGKAPISALTFETSDTNFRRRVEVQRRDATHPDGWRTIREDFIHRYSIRSFSDEDAAISFPQTALIHETGEIRILLHHGDNPPLRELEIAGFGDRYELRFLAQGNGTLAVYLGADAHAATSPDYDTAAIRAGMKEGIAAHQLSLGPLENNPAFRSSNPPFDWSKQRWLLWVAIGLAVAAMSMILFRTAKQID
ncbi:MAG: DUF3999 family protein [Verrucomicrobiota bacterium]